ncbi:MAG: Ppx/GppA phosphatase family protein [Paraclostridium sp.]|uniref:Ppx/GppA phosphatase family protein n=1 Tax=Paraclostridium sp. TaxID=2023273 RepID=UPI003F3F7325
MKIGAIDIGTNSMRLLIADYIDGELFNREKFINTTRIGQGVDKEGYINKESINRNIKALKEFSDLAYEKGCINISCIGTSALRDSKNGADFVKLAKIEANIDIDIISGEEESKLGFSGVLQGLKDKENVLVIDIGGGSTEFILGSYDGIKFSKSENIGALRMTEKFLKKDPICKEEFEEMNRFIMHTLDETLDILKTKDIKSIVGIGGTITSVSAINQKLEVYSMEKIHSSKINKKKLDIILQNLKKMTVTDKKILKGLQPKRADIITAGVTILNIIMKNLEKENIIVSEYDNLEGLLCQNAKKMS